MVSRRLSKNYRKSRNLSKNYKKVGKSRKVSKNIRRKQRNRRKSYKGGSKKMTADRLQLATTLSQFPQMTPSTLVSLGYSMEDIAAATQEAKKIVEERNAKAEA